MTDRTVELLGYIGAICNAVSFIPQLLRVWKLKSARDISYSTFPIFGIGSALWIAYGFHFDKLPVIAANVVTLILSSAIFVLKVVYARREPVCVLPQRDAFMATPDAKEAVR